MVPKVEEDNAQNTQTVFVTRIESPSNELIRRTDDREDRMAMIADVGNRSGTQ